MKQQKKKVKQERNQKNFFHGVLQAALILGSLAVAGLAFWKLTSFIALTVINFLWHQTKGKEEIKMEEMQNSGEEN